jgi:hypothetical protein
MSNKKHGCAACKARFRNTRGWFNYRPFLRAVKRYRNKKIDRDAFCGKWEEARVLARLGRDEQKEWERNVKSETGEGY